MTNYYKLVQQKMKLMDGFWCLTALAAKTGAFRALHHGRPVLVWRCFRSEVHLTSDHFCIFNRFGVK